jgi:hypothetical protein
MPRIRCSVCRSEHKDAIDAALASGSPPMRELARQTGLSHASIFRHKQHGIPAKPKTVSNIKAEIGKLRAAQTRAIRRRDTNGALAISREIRNWMALEAKTRSAVPSDHAKHENLSRGEALALAKAIIESELTDPDVRQWIIAIAERIGESVTATEPQE